MWKTEINDNGNHLDIYFINGKERRCFGTIWCEEGDAFNKEQAELIAQHLTVLYSKVRYKSKIEIDSFFNSMPIAKAKKGKYDKNICVRVNPTLLKKVERFCKRHHMERSEGLRVLIKSGLDMFEI